MKLPNTPCTILLVSFILALLFTPVFSNTTYDEEDSDCEFSYGGELCQCQTLYTAIEFKSFFKAGTDDDDNVKNLAQFHTHLSTLVNDELILKPNRVAVYRSNLDVPNVKQHTVILSLDACDEDSSAGSDDDSDDDHSDTPDGETKYSSSLNRRMQSLGDDLAQPPSLPPRRIRVNEKWQKRILQNKANGLHQDTVLVNHVGGVVDVGALYDPHCVDGEQCPNGQHPDTIVDVYPSMTLRGILFILALALIGFISLFVIIYWGLVPMLCGADDPESRKVRIKQHSDEVELI